jgi:hypothetical protein
MLPTTDTRRNSRTRFFEESYVDAVEGHRSLREVMGQIDGLGPRIDRSTSETSRRPGRRDEVSPLNAESTAKLDSFRMRQVMRTRRACTSRIFGKMDDKLGQTECRDRSTSCPATSSGTTRRRDISKVSSSVDDAIGVFFHHSWPSNRGRRISKDGAISCVDDAIDVVNGF